MLYPEFATCKGKNGARLDSIFFINTRFSLCLLVSKKFEKIYLHHIPI